MSCLLQKAARDLLSPRRISDAVRTQEQLENWDAMTPIERAQYKSTASTYVDGLARHVVKTVAPRSYEEVLAAVAAQHETTLTSSCIAGYVLAKRVFIAKRTLYAVPENSLPSARLHELVFLAKGRMVANGGQIAEEPHTMTQLPIASSHTDKSLEDIFQPEKELLSDGHFDDEAVVAGLECAVARFE